MDGIASARGPIRQRLRVVYARGDAAAALAQRAEIGTWEDALTVCDLPLALVEGPRPRPRLAFGAPLALGTGGERELMDLFLVRSVPVADVRARLETAAPTDHTVVDLHDVWVGAPALAGSIVAADYRLDCPLPAGLDPTAVAAAAADLLASPELARERRRGEKGAHDLRPFLLELAVAPGREDQVVVRMRLRIDPELGTGRPDEMLAALSDTLGVPIEAARRVRERLWLNDEQPAALEPARPRITM